MCLFTKNSLKILLQLQKYIQVHLKKKKALMWPTNNIFKWLMREPSYDDVAMKIPVSG